jgi:hypothetical protein
MKCQANGDAEWIAWSVMDTSHDVACGYQSGVPIRNVGSTVQCRNWCLAMACRECAGLNQHTQRQGEGHQKLYFVHSVSLGSELGVVPRLREPSRMRRRTRGSNDWLRHCTIYGEGAMDGLSGLNEITVTQIYLSELRFQQIQSLVSTRTVERVLNETFPEEEHPTRRRGKGTKS